MKAHGIDIKRLKPGTKIQVKTSHSIYNFEITDETGLLIACGGSHIPEVKKVKFHGSTWGGSCIKIGWIGYDMHMEIGLDEGRVLTTSCVKSACITGDGWQYDVWPTPTCGA